MDKTRDLAEASKRGGAISDAVAWGPVAWCPADVRTGKGGQRCQKPLWHIVANESELNTGQDLTQVAHRSQVGVRL
jgi:hypothetical protein